MFVCFKYLNVTTVSYLLSLSTPWAFGWKKYADCDRSIPQSQTGQVRAQLSSAWAWGKIKFPNGRPIGVPYFLRPRKSTLWHFAIKLRFKSACQQGGSGQQGVGRVSVSRVKCFKVSRHSGHFYVIAIYQPLLRPRRRYLTCHYLNLRQSLPRALLTTPLIELLSAPISLTWIHNYVAWACASDGASHVGWLKIKFLMLRDRGPVPLLIII